MWPKVTKVLEWTVVRGGGGGGGRSLRFSLRCVISCVQGNDGFMRKY